MTEPDPFHPLYTSEGRRNPHPIYKKMRAEEPLALVVDPYRNLPTWIFTRYADCVEHLKDPRYVKDRTKFTPEEQAKFKRHDDMDVLGKHLLGADPPDHTRLRALIAKAFTPQRIEGLKPRIKAIAEKLIDDVEKRGEMDFVGDFSYLLPVTVIAELLGVPLEDHPRFRAWTTTIMSPAPDGGEALRAAGMEFFRYLMGLVEVRRGSPQDDLISALIAAEEAGDKLKPQELIGMLFLLLVAGHETTVNLIANGMLALLDFPDQREKLERDPTLLESAIEEMLRYCGPVETTPARYAIEDIEMHGKTIKRGDTVLAGLLSASHDEERFPDPERFDITRSPNKHIAFGYGIHFCIGAPLARLEATIAFEVVLRRLPGLKLAAPRETLEYHPSLLLHAIRKLPVTF